MKLIQKLTLACGLAALAHLNIAAAAVPLNFAPGSECVRNCGQISQVGNSLIVTLLDKSGKAFKVTTVDIDPTAQKVVIGGRSDTPTPTPMGFGSGNGNGEVSATSVQTYMTTATQLIVYTMTYYYQGGVLIDVKVTEQRFAREKVK